MYMYIYIYMYRCMCFSLAGFDHCRVVLDMP